MKKTSPLYTALAALGLSLLFLAGCNSAKETNDTSTVTTVTEDARIEQMDSVETSIDQSVDQLDDKTKELEQALEDLDTTSVNK